eukprot:TRINITY_DN19395_c0_g1_i1.p1 TRINITY_DN19395_c0_g1~~TRINITY_DN19395_c0_g1_i1.p1  ORF type:complete len:240 (+),score=111.56 TRINITY_DN19395_c0_g1_i1:105-824(+)
MLKAGIVSDSSNHEAKSRLDSMIDYMGTEEYRKQREKENAAPPPKPDAVYIQGRPDAVVAEFGEQVAGMERRETVEQSVDQEDDAELAELRRQRLQRLKDRQQKERTLKSQGHGMYREVSEKDFLPEVTSTGFVAVHFFHSKFERCKIMDEKMGRVTPRQVQVKFLRINAEEASFFVEKLSIQVLPCVILFKDGVAVDKIVGFEGLSYGEDFPVVALEKRICATFKLELSSEAFDEDDQ